MNPPDFTGGFNEPGSYTRFSGCVSSQSYLVPGNQTVSIGSFDYTSFDQSRPNFSSSLCNLAGIPTPLIHMDLFSRTSSFEALHGFISNPVTSSVSAERQAINEHDAHVPMNHSRSMPTTYASLTYGQPAAAYSYFVQYPKF